METICFGCRLKCDLEKVRTSDRGMKMHHRHGREGSVLLHGAARKERNHLCQVEYEPRCYLLALRRFILNSLDVLKLSEFWKGLNYKDFKHRRLLLPQLQDVMDNKRAPTRELEVSARNLSRYTIKNHKM